jgi:hypothetical protein
MVVDYYYLRIVEGKMNHDQYPDLVINEENFVGNNWIEIEDLRAQHDKEFVGSKYRFYKKNKTKKEILFTKETSGDGEFCRRGDDCFTSPIGL